MSIITLDYFCKRTLGRIIFPGPPVISRTSGLLGPFWLPEALLTKVGIKNF